MNPVPGLDPQRHPTVSAARAYTLERLAQVRDGLELVTDELGALETVAVGGSFGRLEAHPASDVDCILVARPEALPLQCTAAVDRVLAVFAESGFKAPKADGIYRRTITRTNLLDASAHGSLDEPPAVFGKRMQLLLDTRAVYREGALATLQRDVLDWYAAGFLDHDPRRGWTALINDTMRYLHAYAGWQQFKFARSSDDSWSLRQRKLRSTRLVTFAGLLVLLGESNARADKREWLLERLHLTPIERLAVVMQRYDPDVHGLLLDAYEATQRALGDAGLRRALRAGGPDSLASLAMAEALPAPALYAAERTLSRLLTAFVLDRRGDWDPRFFERLLL